MHLTGQLVRVNQKTRCTAQQFVLNLQSIMFNNSWPCTEFGSRKGHVMLLILYYTKNYSNSFNTSRYRVNFISMFIQLIDRMVERHFRRVMERFNLIKSCPAAVNLYRKRGLSQRRYSRYLPRCKYLKLSAHTNAP